jgi:ABC-type branched-subunit amino acid transport system substrate-binding protein
MVTQHILHVGWGTDNSYCSVAATTAIWGFGFEGCQIVPSGTVPVPDTYAGVYTYVSKKTGKQHPSVVLINNDTATGKSNAITIASQMSGDGFNMVSVRADLPSTVSDFTPFIQRWIKADSGKQPDMIVCAGGVQCLQINTALKAIGFTGTYFTAFGPLSAIAKALAGSITIAFYNTEPSAGLTQLKSDFDAFKPGTALNPLSNVPAYFGADMFIEGVKAAIKAHGKSYLSPETVQQALSSITWQIDGAVGPVTYPASTVIPTPNCTELLTDNADGSFTVVQPYTCNTTSFKQDPKFGG